MKKKKIARAGNVYELCFISEWGIVHIRLTITSSFLPAMKTSGVAFHFSPTDSTCTVVHVYT